MFINLIEEFWSCAHIEVHISLRPVQAKISLIHILILAMALENWYMEMS